MASKNLDLSRWVESTDDFHSSSLNVSPVSKDPLMANLESSELLEKYREVPHNMIGSISPGMNIRYLVKGDKSIFSRFRRGGIVRNIGKDSKNGLPFLYVTTINFNRRGAGSGWKVILDNVEKIWVRNEEFSKLRVANLEMTIEEASSSRYSSSDRKQNDSPLLESIPPDISNLLPDTIQVSDQIADIKYLHENYMKTLNVGIQKNRNDMVLIAQSIGGIKQEIRKIEEVLKKIIFILKENGLRMNTSAPSGQSSLTS